MSVVFFLVMRWCDGCWTAGAGWRDGRVAIDWIPEQAFTKRSWAIWLASLLVENEENLRFSVVYGKTVYVGFALNHFYFSIINWWGIVGCVFFSLIYPVGVWWISCWCWFWLLLLLGFTQGFRQNRDVLSEDKAQLRHAERAHHFHIVVTQSQMTG